MVAEGRPTRTIAIESEDAAAVVAAVRSVGLGGFVNTSYPRGLTALVDDEPARYAVIDVGTNSVKFHVGERSRRRDVADDRRPGRDDPARRRARGTRHDQRRGSRADGRRPSPAWSTRRSGNNALAIAAVGTAGLRIATNGDEVVAAIAARTGVTVEVIPGEEESRLAYLAVKADLGLAEGSLVVFDTGGGSTQFTFGQRTAGRRALQRGRRGGPLHRALRARGGGDAARCWPSALAAIAADLARIDGRPAPDALVAMGGAVTNITAVKHALATYDPDVVQGSVLDRAEIDRQIELYRTRDVEARRAIIGLQPKRADVILAGACVVRTVMEMLGQDSLTVSDRGLRHGLLVERFGA